MAGEGEREREMLESRVQLLSRLLHAASLLSKSLARDCAPASLSCSSALVALLPFSCFRCAREAAGVSEAATQKKRSK